MNIWHLNFSQTDENIPVLFQQERVQIYADVKQFVDRCGQLYSCMQ